MTRASFVCNGAILLAAASAFGQALPHGPQFQVNTYTTSDQLYAATAIDGHGNFIVAWESDGSSGTDSSYSSIQARRYDAHGRPVGNQFQVNTYTTDRQNRPAVAASDQGRFVIVWDSRGSPGPDPGTSRSIQARIFDASGAPLGEQFQVNSFTPSLQLAPAVSMSPQGSFVVVWQSYLSGGTDHDDWSVHARRFGPDGSPLTADFQVNTYTTGSQGGTAVTLTGAGGFVVAWTSDGSSGSDTSEQSIQARFFDSLGSPLSAELQVNSNTNGYQVGPSIASGNSSDVVIVWRSYLGPGERSVEARRLDATGQTQGAQFRVDTAEGGNYAAHADVGMDERGGFLVVWQWPNIHGRRFHPSGIPIEAPFELTNSTGTDAHPSVALDYGGNFIVAWESETSIGTDSSGYSIQARAFDSLFRDGFETGDSARWSAIGEFVP